MMYHMLPVYVCLKGLNADGVPYEEVLCGDSKPRGVLLLGDSAGAHFHIPRQWVYAPLLSQVSSDNIYYSAPKFSEMYWIYNFLFMLLFEGSFMSC